MKTEEFQYEVKFAEKADIANLVDLAVRFWNESDLSKDGVDVNTAAFTKVVGEYISSGDVKCLIAVTEGQIIGYFMLYRTLEYKTKYDGELYQFFVHPDYWGSGVSRALVGAAVDQFDKWDCVVSFASASPEISNLSLKHFRNLFAKFGYEETGIIMKRKQNHGR